MARSHLDEVSKRVDEFRERERGVRSLRDRESFLLSNIQKCVARLEVVGVVPDGVSEREKELELKECSLLLVVDTAQKKVESFRERERGVLSLREHELFLLSNIQKCSSRLDALGVVPDGVGERVRELELGECSFLLVVDDAQKRVVQCAQNVAVVNARVES